MKPFTALASIVFTLVAIAQLLRVALGWAVSVNGYFIPRWISLVALVIAATLAVMIRREARR
jgi:uncharacterized membrane protein